MSAGFTPPSPFYKRWTRRQRTGEAAKIDLSQFECSVAMIGPLLLSSAIDGTAPLRPGNRSAAFAPQGVYRCAGQDQWCALSVENDQQWRAFGKVIGLEDWASDRRFAELAGRIGHHDEIDRNIETWTRALANSEVEDRLRAAGISAARVRRVNELMDETAGATVFVEMKEKRIGAMRTTRLPFSLSSGSLPAPSSAPGLGEHSAEVLRDWLGMTGDEIKAIAEALV
jgi:crotonobetainyl-CoA:carnitine CoA-transferase CaiB-like acyl-CoA transferase